MLGGYKDLLSKCEDLSLDPQHLWKKPGVEGRETGGSLASPAELVSFRFNERPCLKGTRWSLIEVGT